MKNDISIIQSLDFSLGTKAVKPSPDYSALQNHYIREIADFGIDKIYFSGEFPSIYFKKVDNFEADSQKEILAIHKKIWNQGKVPFLYVESPFEVRVYNCYEKPVYFEEESKTIEDIELYQTALDDLKELKTVFDKVSIETGRFWKQKKYAKAVKNDSRVEEELIKNLKRTRQILQKELPTSVIHNLLLRSLFILYLEDRGATDAAFYQKITGLKDCTTYFKILKSKEATYRLFEALEDRFNGNLSPILEEEAEVTIEHLSKIKACFWSEIRINGQLELFDKWRLFNFEIIPIQLLSEIYEEFLGVQDPKGKAKAGAFYTPHPLAEFVLNQLLPYPTLEDTRYNIKTLDPTCGSGIFLVETLNRLLDRWEMAHPNKKLTFDIICQIVQDNIFGIEINGEAIKVAAFSIYLAMLNRLNPKTLWQNKRFPYLIFDPNETDEKKQGKNLFLESSLTKSPMEAIELVVGNPPFKRGGLKKAEQKYLDKRGYASELVLAFLDRVTTLAPNAKYGLICGSKPLLFNNGSKYHTFRKFLFNENYVEKVFNFSILRRVTQKEGGRNLFASAVSPISIVFYSKETPKNSSDKILYAAPKTSIKNRMIDGIAIDPTDVKYLPRTECQKPDTKIWKVAMWASEMDFRLITYYKNNSKPILDFIELNKKNVGRGFQTSKPKTIDIEIKEIPHISARKLERYFTEKIYTEKIDTIDFELIGNKNAYKKPHLLIKEGQRKKQFCASYLDYDCSFRDTILGIYSEDSSTLKLLTLFLNSNLAFYLMFLTSADWGIERERVKPNEVFKLPNLVSSLSNEIKSLLLKYFDKIIQTKKVNLVNEAQIIEELEQQIETTLWDALNLSDTEKILIEDLLNYTLDAFQNKGKSIAYHPTQLSESKQYAQYLCKGFNDFMEYDDEFTAWATVFDISSRIPLNVVVLHINKEKPADFVLELPEKEIGQLLKQMEQYSYEEYAESMYYRRFFTYFNDDVVYIIKPNEKRFWSRSTGINDASEIIGEYLIGNNE